MKDVKLEPYDVATELNKIKISLSALEHRFKKLTEVIYNYLEASSSIALSSVKAALKNI